MKRRAFTLIELITMMPFVAAMTLTGSLIVSQGMYLQAEAGIQVQDDAVMRDVARRLRADAAAAGGAALADGTLQLTGPEGQVSYSFDGRTLTRTLKAVKEGSQVFTWKLQRFEPKFAIEPEGKVAYLTCPVTSPRRTGELRPTVVTIAARVGRGGGA